MIEWPKIDSKLNIQRFVDALCREYGVKIATINLYNNDGDYGYGFYQMTMDEINRTGLPVGVWMKLQNDDLIRMDTSEYLISLWRGYLTLGDDFNVKIDLLQTILHEFAHHLCWCLDGRTSKCHGNRFRKYERELCKSYGITYEYKSDGYVNNLRLINPKKLPLPQ